MGFLAARRLPRGHAPTLRQRRQGVLCLLLAAAVWQIPQSSRGAFVPRAGRAAGDEAVLRGARCQRAAQAKAKPKSADPYTKQMNEDLEKVLYPPEKMWKVSEDGTVLRERYPGARDFWSTFWSILQPTASLAFLIVGASSLVGPIVDWTPITKEYLFFLRPPQSIQWVPQGAFMSFYGFFGFFLFGPLQWYLVITNKGYGVAEFDKKIKRLSIIRDNELITDMPFSEIDKVVLEWNELAFGKKEVLLVDKDGQEVRFMHTEGERFTKRILERRAAILADFLGKELEVKDMVM